MKYCSKKSWNVILLSEELTHCPYLTHENITLTGQKLQAHQIFYLQFLQLCLLPASFSILFIHILPCMRSTVFGALRKCSQNLNVMPRTRKPTECLLKGPQVGPSGLLQSNPLTFFEVKYRKVVQMN